jgi:hypothetical protein
LSNVYTAKLKEKLREALQAVAPIMALVLLLCFSVAPISPSILLPGFIPGVLITSQVLGLRPVWKQQCRAELFGMEAVQRFLGFALPVTSVAGMRLMEAEPETEA